MSLSASDGPGASISLFDPLMYLSLAFASSVTVSMPNSKFSSRDNGSGRTQSSL